MRTDHVDFYLIHAIFDSTVDSYLSCGCIEYFLEQKKAGRIKYLGFSIHAGIDTLKRVVSHHRWDFAQIQLNYLDWEYGTAKQEYDILTENGIPVIVMEPVAEAGWRRSVLKPTPC
jgi:predicted aldo/keto reductase-like oxidoreductase